MHQTANAPTSTVLDDGEDLDRMILTDLRNPGLTHTTRGPASVAHRLGLERLDVLEAMNRLEAEGRLHRWMGLRLSEAGVDYLNDLNRRA